MLRRRTARSKMLRSRRCVQGGSTQRKRQRELRCDRIRLGRLRTAPPDRSSEEANSHPRRTNRLRNRDKPKRKRTGRAVVRFPYRPGPPTRRKAPFRRTRSRHRSFRHGVPMRPSESRARQEEGEVSWGGVHSGGVIGFNAPGQASRRRIEKRCPWSRLQEASLKKHPPSVVEKDEDDGKRDVRLRVRIRASAIQRGQFGTVFGQTSHAESEQVRRRILQTRPV